MKNPLDEFPDKPRCKRVWTANAYHICMRPLGHEEGHCRCMCGREDTADISTNP